MVPDTGPGSGAYLLSYEGGVECAPLRSGGRPDSLFAAR